MLNSDKALSKCLLLLHKLHSWAPRSLTSWKGVWGIPLPSKVALALIQISFLMFQMRKPGPREERSLQ